MPLITITSYPPADSAQIPKLIADVRDSGAKALNSSINNIWVIFHSVQAGHYLQGSTAAQSLKENSHPPTITIKAQTGRTPSERKALTRATAEAVARGLSIPAQNVWIHYEEMRPEDVWFESRWSAE